MENVNNVTNGPQGQDMKALEAMLNTLKEQLQGVKASQPKEKLAMIVFSGDLDRALAAFIIATGAVAMGMEVTMFFTFWGTPLLRDPRKVGRGKDFFGKMFGMMLPKGLRAAKLSKLNMGGVGTGMMKYLMKKKNVASLEQLLEMAKELGVKIVICELSMQIMGFKKEEMIDYPDLIYAGVAKFLEEAMDSKIQLFI
jgi:peroxiredoxin family protein